MSSTELLVRRQQERLGEVADSDWIEFEDADLSPADTDQSEQRDLQSMWEIADPVDDVLAEVRTLDATERERLFAELALLDESAVFRPPFEQLLLELNRLLGGSLVAYLAGVRSTETVDEWTRGEMPPGEGIQRTLQLALRVARMIANADDQEIAQAWFQGLNPQLDGISPARLLRFGDPEQVRPEIIAAARAFIVGG